MLLIQIASLGLVLWRAQSTLPSGYTYTYTRVSGQLTGGAFIASKFIRRKGKVSILYNSSGLLDSLELKKWSSLRPGFSACLRALKSDF
jgi:hypothetical protein